MKKLFSIMALLALVVTLNACGSKEECEPVIKEVIKEVPTEVIKEVIKEVPVEVEVQVPAAVDMERMYQPGTYFKATAADEKGIITYAVVVVDQYGRVAGVHLDNTTTQNKYLLDEESGDLYVYVAGVQNVIPNSYRKITLGSGLPTVEDAITTDDLVEGYPWHDAKIATLRNVKANETARVVDGDKENTWSSQMDLLATKIIADQTTYGINLYTSGNAKLTNTVKGVTVPVGKEIELVQSILDNEAKLGEDTVLVKLEDAVKGTYKPGTYTFISEAYLNDDKSQVIYNTNVVVVDTFGKIAGVLLDETVEQSGVSTTKWVLGDAYNMASSGSKEWYIQSEAIANAIVANQGVNGFTFGAYNNPEKKVALKDLTKTRNGVLVNPAEITNIAGATIKVNNVLRPLIENLSEVAAVTLVPGVYQVNDGVNMMTIIVKYVVTDKGTSPDVNVGDQLDITKEIPTGVKAEARIVAMNLDSLTAKDQAYITIDGEEYELYTFDKGSLDLSLEEVKTPTLIYKNGDKYEYAQNEDKAKGYEIGDTVKFDYAGYDEAATIKPVKANSTKKALGDKYGLATADGQLEWYEQATAYEQYVVENGYAAFNMTDSMHTDSMAGVTIKVGEYNALLNQAILTATKGYNRVDNSTIVKTTLKGLGLDDYKLAKGNYTANSDVPTKDGGQYIFNMMVLSDNEVYVWVDETIEVNGTLTTKSMLGEDYKVSAKDDELVLDPKDGSLFSKVMYSKLAANGVLNASKALNRYDYELDTEIEYAKGEKMTNDAYLAPYVNAIEKVLIKGLRGRVAEVQANVAKKISDGLGKQFIVASDPANEGRIEIEIPFTDLYLGKDHANGKEYYVELDITEVSKFVDLKEEKNDSESKYVYTLTAETRDVPTSTVGEFAYTIEFDDYEAVNSTFKVTVLSNYEYKNRMLNYKDSQNKDVNAKLQQTYADLLDGTEVVLALNSSVADVPSRLGNAEGKNVNSDLMFRIEELKDIEAQLVSIPVLANKQAATLAYANGQFTLTLVATDQPVPSTLDKNQLLEIPTLGIKLEVKTQFNLGEAISKVDFADKFNNPSDTLTAEAVLANLLAVNAKEVYPAGTKIVVNTTQQAKDANKEVVIGTLSVRAFFDAEGQRETKDGLLTWQKGEASRDFSFDVYSPKAAVKEAKAETGAGNLLTTITNNVKDLVLTSAKDIAIQGLDIKWTATDGNNQPVAGVVTKANGKDLLNIVTTDKTQKIVLTAKFVKANSDDEVVAGDSTKVFEFTVQPTSTSEVAKKLENIIKSGAVLDLYMDYAQLSKDQLTVIENKIANQAASLGISGLEFTWTHSDGTAISNLLSIKQVIIDEIGQEVKAGDLFNVEFNLDVKYVDAKDVERTLSTTLKTTVFANKTPDTKEVTERVVVKDATTDAQDFLNQVADNTKSDEVQIVTGISGAELSGKNYKATKPGKVKFVLPVTEQVDNFTVDAAEQTVEVVGKFQVITVTTAENTFVAKAGTTIDKLEAVKGNIVIEKGASVGTISIKAPESGAIYTAANPLVVTVKDGNKPQFKNHTNDTLLYIEETNGVKSATVYTAKQLELAVNKYGVDKIELGANIEINDTLLVVDKEIAISGAHKISAKNVKESKLIPGLTKDVAASLFLVTENGSLKLTNSEIAVSSSVEAEVRNLSAIAVNGGKVNVDGTKFTVENKYAVATAIYVIKGGLNEVKVNNSIMDVKRSKSNGFPDKIDQEEQATMINGYALSLHTSVFGEAEYAKIQLTNIKSNKVGASQTNKPVVSLYFDVTESDDVTTMGDKVHQEGKWEVIYQTFNLNK